MNKLKYLLKKEISRREKFINNTSDLLNVSILFDMI